MRVSYLIDIGGENRLTLVVCFRGKDGLVFAADSRATLGDPRGLTAINDTMVKVFQLSKFVGIATYGQGELAAQLVQEIKGRLAGEDLYISQVLEKTRGIVKERYSDWFKSVPIPERQLVGFLIGGMEQDNTFKIYYLQSPLDFAPQLCVTNFAMGGIPQYATYLTHRLYNAEMCRKHLVALATYVISETATQDPKVGGVIRVAEISKEKGYLELDRSYIDKIIRENEGQNKKLREFFIGGENK